MYHSAFFSAIPFCKLLPLVPKAVLLQHSLALLSAAGTLIGSLGGILASNRLTNYRIAQLEKRVDKHNNLVERMAAAEDSIKSAHRRIDDITRRK